jgi:hypothetical protein
MVEGENQAEIIKPPGNMNLAYMVSHAFKHEIWSNEGYNHDIHKNLRRDIQHKALSILWSLRNHPEYLSRPDSAEHQLKDSLG